MQSLPYGESGWHAVVARRNGGGRAAHRALRDILHIRAVHNSVFASDRTWLPHTMGASWLAQCWARPASGPLVLRRRPPLAGEILSTPNTCPWENSWRPERKTE